MGFRLLVFNHTTRFVLVQEVATYLPTVAELASLGHFAHSVALHETLWKSLPKVCCSLINISVTVIVVVDVIVIIIVIVIIVIIINIIIIIIIKKKERNPLQKSNVEDIGSLGV